jgi:adenylate cyclase
VIQAKKTLKKKLLWVATFTIFVLLIIFFGLFWQYYYLPSPIQIDIKSKTNFDLPKGPAIAVMPFVNMSKDHEQEYFCDGITDNITYALSHIPKLLVIARNSVYVYKKKPVNVQKIGYELGVQYIIEGSIQKSKDQIRITVQLIDTGSGLQMWSARFDRELKHIFKLQDEITVEIMKALQINLTEGEQIRRRIEGIDDLQILSKLLKAFWYIYNDSKESNILARKEVEEIIALNPEISSAYFLLGFSYLSDLWYQACEYPIICFGKATEAARKALSLDSGNSDAHFLAGYLFLLRKEHDKAIAEMKSAIALNPNNADAYAQLGYAFYCDDRPFEGIEFIKKAISLNPNPPSLYHLVLGNAYKGARQYQNAIKAYKQSLNIRPENNIFPYINLATTYIFLGREKEAYEAGVEVLKLNPNFSSKQFLKTMPHKNKAFVDSHYEAQRKAGLPE